MGDGSRFAMWLRSGFKYWLLLRVTHWWRCGGRFVASGGCARCDIESRYGSFGRSWRAPR